MTRNWSLPTRYFVLVLVVIALVVVAWIIRGLFQPLIIAGLIAYILSPVVDLFEKRVRMRHAVAVNLVYFISLGIILAIPATLVPVLMGELQTLSSDLMDIMEQLRWFLSRPVTIAGFTLIPHGSLPDISEALRNWIIPLPENALRILESTSRNAAWLLVIVVSVYYLLLDWEHAREWLIRLSPETYRKDTRRLFLEIKKVWSAYLRGQLALMFIVGVVFTIIWFAIGLPGALIIGILTGLFSLVPEIGPLIATLLAIAVALVEGSNFLPISNFWFGLLVLGIYLVLINFKNIWLRPHIMGRSVHMHQGLVFVAIIAAVVFQGILGALIIVPVLASAVVVGRYLRRRLLGLPPFQEPDPFASELMDAQETIPLRFRKKSSLSKE